MTSNKAIKSCDNCTARLEAQTARLVTDQFNWKLNVILGGVAATFIAVGGLIAWTVARVDAIEFRVRTAAADEARLTAKDEARAYLAKNAGP